MVALVCDGHELAVLKYEHFEALPVGAVTREVDRLDQPLIRPVGLEVDAPIVRG